MRYTPSFICSRLTLLIIVVLSSVCLLVNPAEVWPQSGVPAISRLTPDRITVTSTATSITITGSGFTATSVVRVNGTNVSTTFVNSTTITAIIPPSFLVDSAPLAVTVYNPEADVTSNSLTFLVLATSGPSVATISPGYVRVGTTTTITITGNNLLGAVVTCQSSCSGISIVVQPQVSASSIELVVTPSVDQAMPTFLLVTTPAGQNQTGFSIYSGGEWQATPSPTLNLGDSPMVRLLDGRILVASVHTQIYDPNTGTWTVGPDPITPRGGNSITLLPDGRVLITGGRSPDTPPIYRVRKFLIRQRIDGPLRLR